MTELAPRIVVDPGVQSGKPVIKGTRVPVEIVLGHLAAGETTEDVCSEYGITADDVRAALAYASRLVADEMIRAI